jgi:exopolysaccharide production protein ExoF
MGATESKKQSAMNLQYQFRARTSSVKALWASPRKGTKAFFLVLGVFGLAALAAGAVKNKDLVNKNLVNQVFDVVVQKSNAAIPARNDQPAQATAGSSPSTVLALRMPARVGVAALLLDPSAGPAGATSARLPKAVGTAQDAPSALAGLSFGVGDRLKVAFFERVDAEEDKWGRTSSALRSIQQRPELSGEYTVQEDGTISVPLLGAVPVANRSAQQVHAALVETFEQLLGRKGMVNVLLLERSPIYVLGPVKNPGSFKYVPGTTVLHAIALAGGLDRGANDQWQKIETVREIQKRSGAAGAMLKLMARAAVLKAERDRTVPKIPLRLMELVGVNEATGLVNEQSDRRKPVALARKDRERAILGAVESAKQDLVLYGRTGSLDELIKLRQERVNSMRPLVDRNVLSKTVLDQVQSELSEAEQRRQDAINQYGMAKQRLASVEAEGLRIQADLKNDLETEIDVIERQIADNEREFSTSEGVLSSMPATRAQFAKEPNRVTYQIVRQTTAGPVGMQSTGMTLLQPGDLVNIIVGESEATEQPPAATTPAAKTPAEGLPVGRAANNRETGRTVSQD